MFNIYLSLNTILTNCVCLCVFCFQLFFVWLCLLYCYLILFFVYCTLYSLSIGFDAVLSAY